MPREVNLCTQIPHDLQDWHFVDLFPAPIVPSPAERLLVGPLDLLSAQETHTILQILLLASNDVTFIVFNVLNYRPLIPKYFPCAQRFHEMEPKSPSVPPQFSLAQSTARPECLRPLIHNSIPLIEIANSESLREAIQSFASPKLSAAQKRLGINPRGGILLSGPSGTGKTQLARSLAHYARSNWGIVAWQVNNALLFSPYLGASEQGLREAFAFCRGSQKCILVFDGILDVICSSRRTGVERRLLTTLLNELDGIGGSEWRENVLLIATTHNSAALDEALTRAGRFDFHFDLPYNAENNPSLQLKNQRKTSIENLFPLR